MKHGKAKAAPPRPLEIAVTPANNMVQTRFNQPVAGFELSAAAAENYANALLKAVEQVRAVKKDQEDKSFGSLDFGDLSSIVGPKKD